MVSGPSRKKASAGTASPGVGSPGGGEAAPDDLSAIDFSGADASLALAECADLVEVQEGVSGVGAVYEEVAVLYANGSTREAEALLEAVLANDTHAAGEGLWMMLLDLYQLTGQRERFESRVLDYATRFERSPPSWVDLGRTSGRSKVAVAPLVNLAGNLGGQAAAQLQQLVVVGEKSGAMRIDLKRLRGVDEAGCTLLLDAIQALTRERAKVTLLNCESLIAMLDKRIEAGRAEGRDAWMLMLELLQHTGEHERFDQLALDYAITFEESPPSWEPRVASSPAASVANPSDRSAAPGGMCLDGELTAANNEPIRRLAALAADQKEVVVDCSQLRRLDFVSAGTLFNVLSTLRAQGKHVRLQHVNAMVGALLRVMGVDQVAHITLHS